ncbi:MAG: penicillin-binding protein 2 [Armatimonadetes bacterium]|nr:penicillin-binding protein 2 [Armatimonadota bacterium]
MGTARRDHFSPAPAPSSEGAAESFAPVSRVRVLGAVVAVVIAVLVGRLYVLQVVGGTAYRAKADDNRSRMVRAVAPRGVITDSDGKALVSNTAQFTVFVDPDELPKDPVEREAVLDILAPLVSLPPKDVAELKAKTGTQNTSVGIDAKAARKTRSREPVAVAEGVSMHVLSAIDENEWRLPGVTKVIDPVRRYERGTFAAHLLGYIGPVTPDDLKNAKLKERGYQSGDFLGKDGIEKSYDFLLNGKEGGTLYEIDARGRRKQALEELAPTVGATIQLTLERQVQEAAENGLKGKVGAAVAIDPRTGAVLALASAPTFDPNVLARRPLLARTWKAINDPKAAPLLDRAIAAAEPPGSTFKIVTSAAGLGEDKVNATDGFLCRGGLSFGGYFKRCHGTHGGVSLNRALAQSCDTYYYQVGRLVGADTLADWAGKFGIGQPSGIDLPNEKKGRMPTPAWKAKMAPVYGNPDPAWYPGDTANIAIGQGDIIATPLQVAQLSAAVANGGTLYVPYTVASAKSIIGETVYTAKPKVLSKIGLTARDMAFIAAGMRSVVTTGTGRGAAIPGVAVAGKSGTAEKKSRETGQDMNVAWFTCYAPLEKPEIAVCVMLYSGKGEALHGGSSAAPIARAMIMAHMARQKKAKMISAKVVARQE